LLHTGRHWPGASERGSLEAMENDRSNYAGLAAAAVFLVGLLIVGNAAVRIAVLALITVVTAMAVSSRSQQFLVLAVTAAVCSTLVAYKAVSFEVRGEATYFNGHGRRHLGTELVTRERSPEKFGKAIKETWAACLFLGLISGICFTFHRQQRRAEYDPNF
jgi:hypothetical protein